MYRAYPSRVDKELTLFADFAVPDRPRRLLVTTHGWHGQIKKPHSDNVPTGAIDQAWFQVSVEMRGRGDSQGRPDCNGWELQDVVDAVEFAKQAYPDRIADPELVTLTGGSGGGGNVMGLLGKFPDYFCRAQAECGIGDYGVWYKNDKVGEFRDEMDVWVGTTPEIDPEAYASRSGTTTACNLLTPLIVFHGELDLRVPAEQSRLFVDAARQAGKGGLVTYYELKGVGQKGHYGGITPAQEAFRVKTGGEFLLQYPCRPVFPPKGVFVVGGYIRTRHFELELENINRVAELHYNLEQGRFALHAVTPCAAVLRIPLADGSWESRDLNSH
jgi:hypothetical protein